MYKYIKLYVYKSHETDYMFINHMKQIIYLYVYKSHETDYIFIFIFFPEFKEIDSDDQNRSGNDNRNDDD